MNRRVIGEGSYGCVHQPSIFCKNKPSTSFNYDSYVSKLMKTKNAEEELSEFVVIKKIDPKNEFHLGEPILCKPNLTDASVKNDIDKCNRIAVKDVSKNPDDYSLLILKYGGPDLKAFCGNKLNDYLKTDKISKVDRFLLEIHNLIKGLLFFKNNGIVHNDIKPQNILFNPIDGKMKYIDFGLMRTKAEILKSSIDNTNYLGIYHWSFPFECGFMKKKIYNQYKNRNSQRRLFWKNELSELIVNNSKINTLKLPINNPDSFSILFSYINSDDTIPNASIQYGYINSFFNGFNDIISKRSYNSVLDRIVDSIDVFGLGFTLQFIINCFNRQNVFSIQEFTRLSGFFRKMYDFDISTRVVDINILLNEYENILFELGVLVREKKMFENHELKISSSVSSHIKSIDKSKSASSSTLSKSLEKFAYNDPIFIKVKCPKNKEFNPITRRCVKKCKPGFVRNKNFKCNNNTKEFILHKIERKTRHKECPRDKDLNPRTNRCNKKCKPGFVRNNKFKCRSQTRKNSKVK